MSLPDTKTIFSSAIVLATGFDSFLQSINSLLSPDIIKKNGKTKFKVFIVLEFTVLYQDIKLKLKI